MINNKIKLFSDTKRFFIQGYNDLKPLKRDKNMYKGSGTESDMYNNGNKYNEIDS